jgi:predicted transposase/invertase (TIGR01784 family)
MCQALRELMKDEIEIELANARKEGAEEAEAASSKNTAKRMFTKGLSIDDVADYLPQLSIDDLRQIEAEVKSLA